jgi:hypothetical protein
MAKAVKVASDTVEMRAAYPYGDEYTGVEYFYDGELTVVNGKVIVPLNRPEWIGRLIATGYEFAGEVPEDFRA